MSTGIEPRIQKFRVRAWYKAYVEQIVVVPVGENPLDESTWRAVEHEHQVDYNLYDVDADFTPEPVD